MGVSKLSLVVFARNEVGNACWEHPGFHVRTDLIYRDRAIVELVRTDT
ncbi:MAG: acetyltransferase [Atopobiaceae bacterium]|nr:acetyltransferase [Atopobiaceae bacterium]